MIERPSWQDRAECKGLADDVDFVFAIGREFASSVSGAYAICASCPVRPECLRSALTAPFDAVGVWGGTTRRDRHAVMGNHPQASYAADRTGTRVGSAWRQRIELAIIELEATFPARYAALHPEVARAISAA